MSVGSDTNFDAIAKSFEEEVYGSSKGYIRERVLWEDMLSEIPQITRGGLSILDAGGGAGRMAMRMGRLGNNVLLCDPSQEMLSRAQESIQRVNLSSCITTIHSPIQELGGLISAKFDVGTFHAVLEWLAEPKATMARLVEFLKRDGYLSLMFYNRNAALIKRILGGEFGAALQESENEDPRTRWGNGATPLAEETVREWLDELGLRVRSKSGIRIFHDHVKTSVRDRARLDALLETEKDLRKREPFASLGQHVHLTCERAQ